MPSIFVIHWQKPRYTGLTAVEGDTTALARAILAGDEFTVDQIRRVDRYDSEEGWAQLFLLGDVARALAMLAHIEQPGGGAITEATRDFIEEHGSLALARGLVVIDKCFEAA